MPPRLQRQGEVAESIFGRYTARLSHTEAVEAYFRELYDLSGEAALDKEEILKCCRQEMPQLKTIDRKFQLIDDDVAQVLIPFDEEAEALLAHLRTEQGAQSRILLRRAGVYTVGVRQGPFQRLLDVGAVAPLWESSTALYVLTDLSLYDEAALPAAVRQQGQRAMMRLPGAHWPGLARAPVPEPLAGWQGRRASS